MVSFVVRFVSATVAGRYIFHGLQSVPRGKSESIRIGRGFCFVAKIERKVRRADGMPSHLQGS